MKNRILSTLFVLVFIMCLLPGGVVFAYTDSGFCGDDVTWHLDNNGTLTISGTGPMDSYLPQENYPAPWDSYTKDIKQVVIEQGVTRIGENVFAYCRNLTGITIPDGIKSIENYAFYGCESLKSITLPDSVTKIGEYAFYDCSDLTNINIPDGVTSIESNTFNGCSSLTSITIPKKVVFIGEYAFDGCSSLESIIMDSASILRGAFGDCINLTDVYFTGSKEDWNGQHIEPGNESLTDATIHYNYTIVTVIASGSCGENATWTLDDLGTLTINGTGQMYDYSVLAGNPAPWYSNNTDIKKVVIGTRVTSIGSNAFYGCSNLAELIIPEAVNSIGEYAFYKCSGITDINIPETVTNIGSGAFCGCDELTDIIIPEGVTRIENYSFYECSDLISIVIPKGVAFIGDYAFLGCENITDICYTGSETDWRNISIKSNNSNLTNATIHYDYTPPTVIESGICGKDVYWTLDDAGTFTISGTGPMYDYASYAEYPSPWYDYTDNIKRVIIEKGVTSIGDEAFRGCRYLTKVTMNEELTLIGSYAFAGCRSLTNISIPEGVESIGVYAFHLCNSLTKITIPDGVWAIGNYAFADCSSLTDVNIPGKVTNISHSAFEGCSNLTSIIIAEGVDMIEWCAFARCTALTSVTIPNSVTYIDDDAFYNCSSLTDVYYAGTKREWNDITIGASNECLTNATIHCKKEYYTESSVNQDNKSINVYVSAISKQNGVLIATEFDKYGKLLQMKYVDVANVNKAYTVSFDNSISEESDIKVFVWSSFKEMKALSEVEEI